VLHCEGHFEDFLDLVRAEVGEGEEVGCGTGFIECSLDECTRFTRFGLEGTGFSAGCGSFTAGWCSGSLGRGYRRFCLGGRVRARVERSESRWMGL